MAWRTYQQKINSRYLEMSDLPSPKQDNIIYFDTLAGGLNIFELDYRLNKNESPEMQNLRWRDGVLASRDGQVWAYYTTTETGARVPIELGKGLCTYETLWHGKIFAHIGDKIYCFDPEENTAEAVISGVPEIRGTFFLFNDKLYYKTRGAYIVITAEYDSEFHIYEFSGAEVSPFTPVTYINASPVNGSGDQYQPENRLSSDKTIWYNAADSVTGVSNNAELVIEVYHDTFRGRLYADGVYTFTYNGESWEYNGESINMFDYGISVAGTPVENDTVTVTVVTENKYHLPIKGKEIVKILVDGVEQSIESISISASEGLTAEVDTAGWREGGLGTGTFTFVYDDTLEVPTWKYDDELVLLSNYGITITSGTPQSEDEITVTYVEGDCVYTRSEGLVTFRVAPPVTIPPTNNTVQITYRAENEIAYNNIMDCRFAHVYGGSNALCVVVAGSLTQPNAYFWSGQTNIDMDPTYFPMEQYQLAGDTVDPITGFGRQQSYLVIFKEGSVGRTTLNTETINDRVYISLPYVNINAKIGCDLPWSIQLIDNNLVWCNTEQGVHLLKDSSSAYENNIICISQKVNGSSQIAGILLATRAVDADTVCSSDDERRYWINANGKVWVWDYDISEYKNPSWFYYTNIDSRGYVFDHDKHWHIDEEGRLTKFSNIYSDYDGPIDKIYRFAVQNFGTYQVLKNVNKVRIQTRGDTDEDATLEYITDYEQRFDLTNLQSFSWHLLPRNLTYRDLSGTGFAYNFTRKPMCRRVRHFTMRLRNNNAGQDLAIVSAQMHYNYQGEERGQWQLLR